MTRMKIISATVVVFLAQISCYAPQQEYREVTPIPIDVQISSTIKHRQEFPIMLQTEPNVSCYIFIGYYDNNNDWAGKELPMVVANEDGTCKWNWTIPDEAKNGIGEIRGFVENTEDSTSFIP